MMSIVETEEMAIETINAMLDLFFENGYSDITILTCKTEEKSILAKEVSKQTYLYKGRKILFTTCRKFKGLESDAIILIDVEKHNLINYEDKNMYVGASRAKFELGMIAILTETDCKEIVEEKGLIAKKNMGKSIAASFNSRLKVFKE